MRVSLVILVLNSEPSFIVAPCFFKPSPQDPGGNVLGFPERRLISHVTGVLIYLPVRVTTICASCASFPWSIIRRDTGWLMLAIRCQNGSITDMPPTHHPS
ncbi:hypothetical protein EV702DRAFT_1083412 [Suillus placidus]|uniref:Uncharacterized protein n=1 Tax=Suillus placidus TaxID=48579 RepID=A0A9P7A000_9AGAM|nr:hypothetical protein EV702DRAFT_1083412 [Suillus placidus]